MFSLVCYFVARKGYPLRIPSLGSSYHNILFIYHSFIIILKIPEVDRRKMDMFKRILESFFLIVLYFRDDLLSWTCCPNCHVAIGANGAAHRPRR